ncbi:hypothetical protein Q7P37_003921 [Cladosporium fusiforme]
MAALFVLSLLSLCSYPVFAEDAFTVTAPKAGDTVSIGATTTADIEVPISWTVPDAIASRPVFISLVQGNNLSSLSRVEQINSSAPNTGSYAWKGETFDSSLVYNYGYGAPSGCNYSIELKVWTDVVYSGYFTIINPKDDGLAEDVECPEAGANIGPSNQTFPSTSKSEEDGQASGTSAGDSSGTSSEGASQSGSNGGSNSGGGISTTTLAVAVAVPIVVLLIVFGLIIWLGIRRGWFVKKSSHNAAAAAEKGNAVLRPSDSKGFGGANESVRELHANDRPHQLESSPVHELQGGDNSSPGGQHYVVRN